MSTILKSEQDLCDTTSLFLIQLKLPFFNTGYVPWASSQSTLNIQKYFARSKICTVLVNRSIEGVKGQVHSNRKGDFFCTESKMNCSIVCSRLKINPPWMPDQGCVALGERNIQEPHVGWMVHDLLFHSLRPTPPAKPLSSYKSSSLFFLCVVPELDISSRQTKLIMCTS